MYLEYKITYFDAFRHHQLVHAGVNKKLHKYFTSFQQVCFAVNYQNYIKVIIIALYLNIFLNIGPVSPFSLMFDMYCLSYHLLLRISVRNLNSVN
jgi:hypothetical protein